ncbi:g3258 [Coccomyxa elongata]
MAPCSVPLPSKVSCGFTQDIPQYNRVSLPTLTFKRLHVLSTSRNRNCCSAATASRNDRDVQTNAASSSRAVEWDRTDTGSPLEDLPEPEGNWSLPFVGETAEFQANHWEWAHKRVKKFGPVFKSNVFGQQVVVVTDFVGLQKVFGGDHKITQWMTAPSLEALGGVEIMGAGKHKASHMKQRRQQGAAFTPDAMDAYLPRVVETCEEYLRQWTSQDSVSLVPAMSELAFDFAEGLVVGLGIKGEEKALLLKKWTEFSSNSVTYMLDLPGTPYNTAKRARDFILDAIRERVAAKKAEFEAGRARKDTLLSFYASAKVEDGEPLDINELSMNVLMFMFAGSDTSRESHKVLLGMLPDLPPAILDKLREEQARIVERHGPGFGRGAMADMRYADAVAREVLRIWGPAEFLFRTAKEDFELHGKRIKKGTVILASLMYAKACDPRISGGDHVDSPLPRHMDISRPLDSFKPERWLDDTNKLDSSALATFGMGVHFCLGFPLYMMEAKVLLALIARGYDVSNVSGRPVDWGISPSSKSPREDVFLRFTPHKYV